VDDRNHFDEIDAEYVLDEGGMGSRDALAAGKLAFGVSVGENKCCGCDCVPAARRVTDRNRFPTTRI